MENGATLDGIRQQLLESLQRLDCGYVDLYYMHRVCSKVAIEDVAHSLKQLLVNCLLCHPFALQLPLTPCRLQSEGLIKHVGLSEVTASELTRFHAITAVTAIQMEWSIGTRDVEEAGQPGCTALMPPPRSHAPVVPCARELGVAIVAYSPLCRGLLTGAINPSTLPATDRRSLNPRFTADNFSANMAACAVPLARIAGAMSHPLCRSLHRAACARAPPRSRAHASTFAESKGCTAAQLALAWVHAQGEDVFPIPGTKSVSRLLEASAGPAPPAVVLPP